tara:strand:- start:119 stop:379 length:261 start_codon:yes stop_codon:yes gene_type:complete
MSSLDSNKIKGIITINNSLLAKKGLLKSLLQHVDVQNVLSDVIANEGKDFDDEDREGYINLLRTLKDHSWNLDDSIEKIIKDISKK